jgi:hypothetical protein
VPVFDDSHGFVQFEKARASRLQHPCSRVAPVACQSSCTSRSPAGQPAGRVMDARRRSVRQRRRIDPKNGLSVAVLTIGGMFSSTLRTLIVIRSFSQC